MLLIEAGPEEPDVTSVPAFAPVLGRSSIDWNYRTQPEEMTCRAQRGQTCAWLRYVEEFEERGEKESTHIFKSIKISDI